MGGLMNQFYYGKAGQADYTVEQMPTNRKQLFFSSLKVHLSGMFTMNFLYLVFLLPLLFWLTLNYFTLSYTLSMESPEMTALHEQMNEIDGRIAQIDAALNPVEPAETDPNAVGEDVAEDAQIVISDEYLAMSEQELADARAALVSAREPIDQEYKILQVPYQTQQLRGQLMYFLLFLIPGLAIAGIGSVGQMYVLRNWARDEHSFVWSDFKSSIKTNWKQGLLAGLLNGVVTLLGVECYLFYGDMARAQSVFFMVPQVLMVTVLVVWWMMNMLVFPMIITYEMKFRHILRNALVMVLARLPLSVLVFAASIVLPVLLLFFDITGYGLLALVLIYLLIGFSLTGYGYVSYANSCFDKYINPRIEGAPLNKGIYAPEDDEDEMDETDGEKAPAAKETTDQ